MLVAGRADAEFADAGGRMDRVVLPMPVATDHKEVVGDIGSQPGPQLVTFVRESAIGVIVVLVGPVGSDKRSGADEHFPGRAAGQHRFLEPLFLLRPPDRFFRSIRRVVWRAMIPSVSEPDLQVAAPT